MQADQVDQSTKPGGALSLNDALLLLAGSMVSAGSARATLGRPGDQTSALCIWAAPHCPDACRSFSG